MTFLKRWFGRPSGPTHLELRLFLETMVLMMAADGSIDDNEVARFMSQLQAHEELRQLSPQQAELHLQQATDAIKTEGPKTRLRAIARGLPDREQRMAAVSMALAVALGDRKMVRAEQQLLDLMQRTFALSDEDMERARDEAENSLRDRLTNPEARTQEQLYIEVMLLMAAADGRLDPDEMEHFARQLAHHREFEAVTPEQVGLFMEASLEQLDSQGFEACLKQLAHDLPKPEQRLTAFRLALEICMADGEADPREKTLLELLRETFELEKESVDLALQSVIGRQR